jgi:hypothetical protein
MRDCQSKDLRVFDVPCTDRDREEEEEDCVEHEEKCGDGSKGVGDGGVGEVEDEGGWDTGAHGDAEKEESADGVGVG